MRIERLSRDEFDLLCARIAIGEPVSMGELLGARRYASEARERGQLLAALTVGYLAVTRAGYRADVGIGPYGEEGAQRAEGGQDMAAGVSGHYGGSGHYGEKGESNG